MIDRKFVFFFQVSILLYVWVLLRELNLKKMKIYFFMDLLWKKLVYLPKICVNISFFMVHVEVMITAK